MVVLKEEKNSQLFARWLNERNRINFTVYGGDLERPITARAIAHQSN